MDKENKPKHQHFIPRSYLKNFAKHNKDKRFVGAIKVKEGMQAEEQILSTKNICSKTDLYTLPIQTGDIYALEKYYAEHVDALYPDVYALLIDNSKVLISKNQRYKIINTLLSLYFRTPKVLHSQNTFIDNLIDQVVELSDKASEEITLDIDGQKFTFLRDETEAFKKKLRDNNRKVFLSKHLKSWHEFVAYKYQCAIVVYEVEGDIDLITSDNPVSIHSTTQNPFYLFDPTNIIEIPIDRRHYVAIFPNTEAAYINRINRSKRNKWFALTTNKSTERNAEMWVIGYPDTVKKHFQHQNSYEQNASQHEQVLGNLKLNTQLAHELLDVITKNGIYSKETAMKVRSMKALEQFEINPEFQQLEFALNKTGFL